MKYLILPAKDLQSGDKVFTKGKKKNHEPVCALILGQNPVGSHAEFRVQTLVGEENGVTTLSFEFDEELSVEREDKFVDVDVSALLGDLT